LLVKPTSQHEHRIEQASSLWPSHFAVIRRSTPPLGQLTENSIAQLRPKVCYGSIFVDKRLRLLWRPESPRSDSSVKNQNGIPFLIVGRRRFCSKSVLKNTPLRDLAAQEERSLPVPVPCCHLTLFHSRTGKSPKAIPPRPGPEFDHLVHFSRCQFD
jgi:hypothetical protein